MIWIENKTTTYNLDSLPFDKYGNLEIQDISKTSLAIEGFSYPFDVGSFCYVERCKPSKNTTTSSCATVLVNSKSFRKQRVEFVRSYVSFLSNHLQIGKSHHSLKTAVSQFSRFVNWCDKFRKSALDGEKQFVAAYVEFSNYLHNKVMSSQMNINTAAALQLIITTAGKRIYGDPYGDLFMGARRFKKSFNATNVTAPPDEDSAAFAFSIYRLLFEELSTFTIERKPFPYPLKLPNDSFWIFPLPEPVVNSSPHKRSKYHIEKYFAYDFDNGALKSHKQLLELLTDSGLRSSDWIVSEYIQRAERVIRKSNAHKNHRTRKFIASMAIQAFIMMFSSATGMNLAQMSAIPWPKDGLEISNEIQGFKAIKARARGRSTTFHISQTFIKYFKQYLKLREATLDIYGVASFDFLFFKVGFGITKLSGDFSTNFNTRLRRNFNLDIKINTRMWRAYKSDWLVQNKDIATSAMILQNSHQTILKHYSEGSEASADIEMTRFFNAYADNIVISKREKSKPIAMGQCTNIQQPKPLQESAIPTNCSTPEGCLYCENYRVHADEPDVRKLLSCQYLLNASRTLLDSSSQYDEIYPPIIKRIDMTLDRIESTGHVNKEDIEKIRTSVFVNEQLDSYWLGKLKMLETLGVI